MLTTDLSVSKLVEETVAVSVVMVALAACCLLPRSRTTKRL